MAGLKDKAGELLGLLFNSQNPEVSAPKPESGVALQDATGKNSTIYQRIVAGGAGTVEVAIGPTNACADVVVPKSEVLAKGDVNLTIDLPANWFIKITVVTVTIGATTQITRA
jgi:hypothetical protein